MSFKKRKSGSPRQVGKVFPTKSNKSNKYDIIADRIEVSNEVIGHPLQRTLPVEEGNHYTVLAYTDWGDLFIPTIVKWNDGTVDNFSNITKSRANRKKSQNITYIKYLLDNNPKQVAIIRKQIKTVPTFDPHGIDRKIWIDELKGR